MKRQCIMCVTNCTQCERGKFLDCLPFYRMARILGIPRLRSTFYRMRRFLENVVHIHVYTSVNVVWLVQ